jgi:hypothetical protein
MMFFVRHIGSGRGMHLIMTIVAGRHRQNPFADNFK